MIGGLHRVGACVLFLRDWFTIDRGSSDMKQASAKSPRDLHKQGGAPRYAGLLSGPPNEPERGPAAVPERLMWLRMSRGLSVRTVAKMGEVSPSTIERIEKGATDPTAALLYLLAQKLKVRACWLAFGEGPMETAAKECS